MGAQPTAAAAGTIDIGGDLTANRMGFGAMRITGRGVWGEPPSREQAIATLRRVVELGVNFIDTADSYGPAVSEELIAEALYPYPDDLVIATKGGLVRPGPNRWNPDGRPEHLREACEGSLRRLRLEQIPLWQFHRPDPKVPLAESMGVIAQLKNEGKIRHVGISNVSEAQFREAERILPIVSIQNRFNVTDRESEPLIDLCEQEDMVFLPWAPIQQADSRAAVAVAAGRRGATERQIVLAWLLAISPAILPIPGTGSPEHAEENVAATAIELSRDEIEAISKGGLSRRTDAQAQRTSLSSADSASSCARHATSSHRVGLSVRSVRRGAPGRHGRRRHPRGRSHTKGDCRQVDQRTPVQQNAATALPCTDLSRHLIALWPALTTGIDLRLDAKEEIGTRFRQWIYARSPVAAGKRARDH